MKLYVRLFGSTERCLTLAREGKADRERKEKWAKWVNLARQAARDAKAGPLKTLDVAPTAAEQQHEGWRAQIEAGEITTATE
jgi:hypothetical protein